MAAESFDIADVGVKNTAYKLTRPGMLHATGRQSALGCQVLPNPAEQQKQKPS